MALQNYQYDLIMREYSRRQARAVQISLQRQQEIAKILPKIAKLDEEAAALGAEHVRRSVLGQGNKSGALRKALEALTRKKKALLESEGYPGDYLEPPYTCALCQDTGYVDGIKCRCFLQQQTELLYDQSMLKDVLSRENFETFSLEYYPEDMIHTATGLNARQMAQKAFEAAKRFVEAFDQGHENLFLYGETGVGKTFLTHCIAKELLDRGRLVLYFSAGDFFEKLAKTAFLREEAALGMDDILMGELLIIDDLGTELTNSFVSSQLFLCVNERLLRGLPTVISTNLGLDRFSEMYSERTFSRIAGNYQLINLIGSDIRIRKVFAKTGNA